MLKTLFTALLSCNLFFFSSISFAEEPIKPIKAAAPKDKGMVELGKMLFFDPRLSKSGFISCNSCHNL
ncbi:MAG: cytochrome C biogenesis protein CcsA, partial [Nitrosomonadaceae bacterium]|nr:cytochrome C biogenesis protein CcsA [Nitrosomonadaceae bacterium]